MDGTIFNIQEFAVHDGPGIRIAVFLKGCPLRCAWCHNPEGLEFGQQSLRSPGGERLVGTRIGSEELANRLNRLAPFLRLSEGGVTFTGGEPLSQAAFIAEVIERLGDMHVVLDTSGHSDPADFEDLVAKVDLVHFDLKLMSPAAHRLWTGVENGSILSNFEILSRSGIPYVVRVPLVPGVTDTEENLEAIAGHVAGRPGLVRVELLPYNSAAGGKYRACGMVYSPQFDEGRPVKADLGPFVDAGVEARIA